MSPPISPEVIQLLQSLFQERSLLDRVRGQDRRLAILNRIAETREVRVVPNLLPLMATDDALAPQVARAIADLVRDVIPVQLSWLDEQVRTARTPTTGLTRGTSFGPERFRAWRKRPNSMPQLSDC